MKVREVIKEKEGLLLSGPVTENQITEAEEKIGLRFAPDYMEYIANFGTVSFIGHEITGISDLDIDSVVFNTIEERKITKVPDDWYVIEKIGVDGIVMWQSGTGEVFMTQPGSKPKKLYDSFAEYIGRE